MKYVATIILVVVAFFCGRFFVPQQQSLPSIPLAFVQATQPVAVAIEVDLEDEDGRSEGDGASVHDLKGTAVYTFLNVSDRPVSISFPPTRTFHVSETQTAKGDQQTPAALNAAQIINLAPNESAKLSGPWSCVISGQKSEMLSPRAGWEAYTFQPPPDAQSDHNFLSGTLIAFQSFEGFSSHQEFNSAAAHLKLVADAASSPDN